MKALNKPLWAALSLSAALLVSGCGKQAFLTVDAVQAQSAPGSFTIPAKVDILLVVDDTGSMLDASQLPAQIPTFLSGLQNSGWDYHFATVPLTTFRSVTQVMASQYDSNWGGQWIAPFPGATPNLPGTVTSSSFRFPTSYTQYAVQASNAPNGYEAGFKNILQELQSGSGGTNFMRPDAMLVVLMLGNGADTSGVTICTRSDGVTVPYESAGAGATGCQIDGVAVQNPTATAASSFSSYMAQFQALRGSFKFFAAMDPRYVNFPFVGSRYRDMANQTGGSYFDLTQVPLSTVLSTMSSSLQAQRLSMETRYLFIAAAPDTATVRVTKNLNGNPAQAQVIPQDPINGWTYAGYSTVYAIDYPINMNLTTGYAIELHGSAKLHGSDTANVTYKNFGWQNSPQ